MRSVYRTILEETGYIIPRPAALLDIGCGNGAFTRVLAAALPRTAIYATDAVVSEGYTPRPEITFVKGKAEWLPFHEGMFDVVVVALSFHHWADKDKGIKEAYRVLKKGGHLLMGEPLLEGWLSNRFWGWLMQALDGGPFSDFKSVNRYFAEAGFKSVNIKLIPQSFNSLYLISATKE